jgi:hypothetical protein
VACAPDDTSATPGARTEPRRDEVARESSIPRSSSYRFRVVEAGTETPLSGVRVGLLQVFDIEQPLPPGATSEVDGIVTVTLPSSVCRAGSCAFAVSHDAHERVAVGALPFALGEPQDLGIVALPRLRPTRLRVTAAKDLHPVEAARVSASIETDDDGCANAHMRSNWPARSALPDGWSGTTSTDGTATAYLSPGKTYWICVEHRDHAEFWQLVDTLPQAPGELDLVLDLVLGLGGGVLVSCREAGTKRPLADERIEYEPIGVHEVHETRTGVDGRVSIEQLVPGRYLFRPASVVGPFSQIVEVVDGASVEVTLTIPPH